MSNLQKQIAGVPLDVRGGGGVSVYRGTRERSPKSPNQTCRPRYWSPILDWGGDRGSAIYTTDSFCQHANDIGVQSIDSACKIWLRQPRMIQRRILRSVPKRATGLDQRNSPYQTVSVPPLFQRRKQLTKYMNLPSPSERNAHGPITLFPWSKKVRPSSNVALRSTP